MQAGGLTSFDLEGGDPIDSALKGGAGLIDVKPGVGFSLRLGARSAFVGIEAVIDAIASFGAEGAGMTLFKSSQMLTGDNVRLCPTDLATRATELDRGQWLRRGRIVKAEGGGDRSSVAGGAFRGGGGDIDLTERVALALDSTSVWTTGDFVDSDDVTLGWGLRHHF